MTRMLIGRVSVPACPMFPIPAMFAFDAWIIHEQLEVRMRKIAVPGSTGNCLVRLRNDS